jgi:hypothetical protein
VYVFRGGVVPSLTPRYQGPYLVLSHGDKCFQLAVGNNEEIVSIDQRKLHMQFVLLSQLRLPAEAGLQPSACRQTLILLVPPWQLWWGKMWTASTSSSLHRFEIQAGGSHVEDAMKKTPNVVTIDNH